MKIPIELVEQASKGNVVLFCGAGISASEGGLPSGSQLTQELAQRAGLGDVGGRPLPEVAGFYELKMGYQSLIAYVISRVDNPHYIPLRTHQLITALPTKYIITTNWDNLLEDAFRQAGRSYVRIVRDSEVTFVDEQKPLLIKLHGSIEQKDSIVITGDDYYDVFARLPEIANLVHSYFATKTILFIGFGLEDEDFNRLYHEVVRHLGKHKRRAYAIQLNPTALSRQYWLAKNVEIISGDATIFLETLAASLAEQTIPSPRVGQQPLRVTPSVSPPAPASLTTPVVRGGPGQDRDALQVALRVPFKLQLVSHSATEFEIIGLETPMGNPRARSRLPYTVDELAIILKALAMVDYDASRFKPTQRETLERLELLAGSHFKRDFHRRVGEALYSALMAGDVGTAFQTALSNARGSEGVVALQLRFGEDAVDLAQYPWELLYHRRALLPSRAAELTRYISYPEATTAMRVVPPLRMLYVQARPTDLPELSGDEQASIRQTLKKMEEENLLRIDTLSQPTYAAVLGHLECNTVHVLHFDGHGVFARQCPVCGAMNYPYAASCQAGNGDTTCRQELVKVEPQGYLAFERADQRAELIDSETLGTLFYNRPLRLVVLSACYSGSVGGETLFGGVAPALVQAGIPAIVSTQLPIGADAAVKFMQGFYGALARFEPVPTAVNSGRIRMFGTKEWFIPTLYLRSQDDEGQLFSKEYGG